MGLHRRIDMSRQSRRSFRFRAIPAHEPVLTMRPLRSPDFGRAGVRSAGAASVRIDPGLATASASMSKLELSSNAVHRRQRGKIGIHRISQRRQLGGQHLVVPRGELARAVVGQPVSSRLCGRQVGHMNGYGFEAQLSRRLQSSVPDDDRAIGIDHDGLPESVLPDGRGNGIHRRFRNAARVVFVGFESVQGALLDQQRS